MAATLTSAAPRRDLPLAWFRSTAFVQPTTVRHLTFTGVLTDGLAVFGASWKLLVGASAVSAITWFVSTLLGGLVPLGVLILGIALQAPMLAGLMYVGVRCARAPMRGERKPSIDDLFEGFRCYPVVVLTGGLRVLLTFGLSLLQVLGFLMIDRGFSGGGGVSAMALLIAGVLVTASVWIAMLVLTIRLSLAEVLAMDTRIRGNAPPGALDALWLSWRATGPVFWPLLGASVVVVLLAAASMLALCVGIVVFGLPLAAACFGVAYARTIGVMDPGVCSHCGYNLMGLPEGTICPECGNAPTYAVRATTVPQT